MIVLEILIVLVLALGFWVRGSDRFDRTWDKTFPALSMLGGATTARILAWAAPCGLAWSLLGGSLIGSVGVGVAAWVGCLAPWWKSLDLGRREGSFWTDLLMHSLRGVLWVLPMGAVIHFDGGAGWALLPVGLLCGPLYELGYRINKDRGTELGELLFGGFIGVHLILAKYISHP